MSLEQSLSSVEQLLEKVAAALLAADPEAVQTHTTALRDAAVVLLHTIENGSARGQPPISPALKKRVDAAVSQLALQRESLARLSVVTDRQLAMLVPQADPAGATYGKGLASRGAQAGIARVYRSVG